MTCPTGPGVTHHAACACREEHFARMREALETADRALASLEDTFCCASSARVRHKAENARKRMAKLLAQPKGGAR